MYAVIRSGGKQYKVAAGDTVTVDRLDVEVGATVSLGDVLMVGGDTVKVGAPVVEGAAVEAEVLSHTKGAKRMAFKYRRTRRSRVSRGSRPHLTTLQIKNITA